MSDTPETKPDYRSTVFLPKTDFPMKAGLPLKEPVILAKWQAADMEKQIRAARAGREKFILHDGPPYANGDIHIGHALNHILKDMVVRTQTLLGKDAPYVPGWDCHGLPIEWKVEEQYRKKKLNKDEVPIKEFRAECRAYAQGWVDVQREQLKRLGIGGQWDKPYLTMNAVAEGTIVSELLKFAEAGQLYRGAKPVMWSPVEKTALAEAEIEYEDIVSTQIDVAFEIVESPLQAVRGAHALIWTTTPWTIPVNQAIAFGPDLEYAVCRIGDRMGGHDRPQPDVAVLVAAGLADSVSARLGFKLIPMQIIKGSDLAGTIARHPMHHLGGFFAKPRPLLSGEFVTTDTGTGLVHMAPDHGEDDFDLCKAEGIDPVFAVEGDGKYREDWDWLGGQGSVINAKFNAPDGPICEDLRAAGALLAASADCKHSYPHSWRSKAKVIYRCTPQWFIAMDTPLAPPAGASSVAGLSPGQTRERPNWEEPRSGEGEGLLSSTADMPSLAPLRGVDPSRTGGRGAKERALSRWENEGGAPSSSSPLVGEDARGSDVPQASEALSGGQGDLEHGGGREPLGSPTKSLSAADAAASPPLPSPQGGGSTLRQTALNAISATRWVPEKGENRIRSMVEGRPDWVISRQRAWGVPIALFVKRGTNQPLVDDAVNARIVAAIKAGGVDAWEEARAQEYLGSDYDLADYEMVSDILDVWFDSGCTHVFTLESGTWPDLRWPADLYLEGTDQHRGWFQSSLMESCGTRGRAPYNAVLTHGFTMDSKGMKMSKSLGNTISPNDLMRDYGADILRLWALSVDFTEDHRIGKEILAGVADQYRKLRNTFRYLLGALEGFDEAERVTDVAGMPELERYMLSLLAGLDSKLRQAVDDFDFNTYVRALGDFCNEDLSAFYFDIRKDSLYCDGADDPKRRAYRTVLDTMFHALVRWASPVLVFTSEEVWETRYPEGGSVHLLEWPDDPLLRHSRERGNPASSTPAHEQQRDPRLRGEDEFEAKWNSLRSLRAAVNEAIEPLRREKQIRSSLEAEIAIPNANLHDPALLEELFISSTVRAGGALEITVTTNHKCGRCWRHLPEVTDDGELCDRCAAVVAA